MKLDKFAYEDTESLSIKSVAFSFIKQILGQTPKTL